eukprot:SAG11_NODE_994_length_6261_cov_10.558747_1_plen_51_part_10
MCVAQDLARDTRQICTDTAVDLSTGCTKTVKVTAVRTSISSKQCLRHHGQR